MWSNEHKLQFLEYYQMEPILWDSKHVKHKDKQGVHDAWMRISKRMEISIAELKKKRDSLMATIRALVPVEHAQSNNSDKSENNSDYELPPPSPSPVSSSTPSINSCLKLLDLNNSPESEHIQNDDEQPLDHPKFYKLIS
ncbi:unnamed protein product, partial [Brenthis ino]